MGVCTGLLLPGPTAPNGPESASALAERLAVDQAAVQVWLDEGLPTTASGLIDPFVAVNWLSWGRLGRCPLLERRWAMWLRWFTTPAQPTRLHVVRLGSLHLPESLPARIWVAEPGEAPGQQVCSTMWQDGEALERHRLLERPAASEHTWRADDEIALEPVVCEPGDRPELERLITELAGSFRYGYRRHVPGEDPRWEGTCLDLARLAGQACGRPWRLVMGVVAHRSLANPHAWIEIEDTAGWVPVDPTLPAVARMLGADWRACVPLAIGRHDARRIRLGTDAHPLPGIPGGATFGSAVGEAVAGGRNAAACADWALGECRWSIAAG